MGRVPAAVRDRSIAQLLDVQGESHMFSGVQGRASDMLHGAPKGCMRKPLKRRRTQRIGESLKEFYAAVEQLAHHACL